MTEKYLLKKNVSTTVFAFFVNIALVFLTYRILISVGSISLVGIWATTLAWASIIRFGDLGMANAAVRFVARHDLAQERERIQKVISIGVTSNALLFFILTIIVYLILSVVLKYAFDDPQNLRMALELLPYLLVGQFLSNTVNMFIGILTGLHKGYLASYMRIGGNLSQLALVYLLVPSFGLIGLAMAQIIQFSLMGMTAWIVIIRSVGLPGILPARADKTIFLEMLNFSISAQIASIANGVFEPLTKIFLSVFTSAEVQGLYELAYKSAFLPRNGIVAAVNAVLPAMSHLYHSAAKEFHVLYGTTSKRALLASLAVMALVAAFAPAASYLWLGEINKSYWEMVCILCVAFAISGWASPAFLLAQVTGRFRYNIFITIGSAVVLSLMSILMDKVIGFTATNFVILIAVVLVLQNLIIKQANETTML